MADFHTLVINLGNLAGVTALAVQTDAGHVGIWQPRLDIPSGPALLRSVQKQAQIMGIQHLEVVEPLYRPRSTIDIQPQGLDISIILLAAAAYALEHECTRLVWPMVIGPDYDGVSRELERAQLITQLIELDMGGEALVIDLPFVELSDDQLAEVALHADAPVKAAWWCEYDREKPCGGCDACLRWRRVVDAAIPPGRAKIAAE